MRTPDEEMNSVFESNRYLHRQKSKRRLMNAQKGKKTGLSSGIYLLIVLVSFVVAAIFVLQAKLQHSRLDTSFQTIEFIPGTDEKIFHPDVFHLKDSNVSNDFWTNESKCFKKGIIGNSTARKGCACLPRWHGPNCAIPDSVWHSDWLRSGQNRVRLIPITKLRRIVYATWFRDKSSFDSMNFRMKELADVVDVFFIIEANFSKNCERIKPELLVQLRVGYMKEYQHKIVYSMVHNCPADGVESWDEFLQTITGIGVLHLISNFRLDDVILVTNPDDVISKDYVYFLKTIENIPEPFAVRLGKNSTLERETTIIGSTVKYISNVCEHDMAKLLLNGCSRGDTTRIKRYERINNASVRTWATSEKYPAAWRCT
ncbi:Uncharacterised protein g4328 [Pycnogonum litorale]